MRMPSIDDRYWLFSYERYYPEGGINDFVMSCNNLDLLHKEACKISQKRGWGITVEVWDMKEGECVVKYLNLEED